MFPVFQFPGHVFVMPLEFSQNVPNAVHCGNTVRNILNVPLWVIFGTLFWFFLNFTDWEHHNPTDGNTAKNIVNEPLGNIMGTFFGKIQGLPTDYLIGTLWSHDLENCECTDTVSGQLLLPVLR